MSWFNRMTRRQPSVVRQVEANLAAGRDKWHGIANHTTYTPRERLPQVGPYPAAAPYTVARVIPAVPASILWPSQDRTGLDELVERYRLREEGAA